MVGIAQLVSVPGCGPGGRGFESHYSPHTRKSAKIDINCAKSQKKQSYFVAKQCNKWYYRLRTKGYRQAVRHQILILAFVGSNPATPANDSLAQPVEHRTFNAMVRSSNLRWVTKETVYGQFFLFTTEILRSALHGLAVRTPFSGLTFRFRE